MTMYARYALYYTPPPGPLSEALTHWLGWDPASGNERPHPHLPGLPRPASALTERPRKYGPHGTLKPPFHLADGQGAEALERALHAFTATRPPVTLGRLHVARIGSFLALVPSGDTGTLAARAAEIVQHFDPFRAPPDASELDRRRKSSLSPRQEQNLARWGYPFVFGDFRFHITLTGPLPQAEIATVHHSLSTWLAPHLIDDVPLDALSLLGSDPQTGRFHLLDRASFTG